MLPPSTSAKRIDNIFHVVIIMACCMAYPYLGVDYGYSTTQGDLCRLTYMFAHVNLLHLVLNISAFWLFSRYIYGTIFSPMCLLIAWAATFGTEMTIPTQGMSAICYAQMGVITAYFYKKKWCMEMLISALLVNCLGFVMDSMNVRLHAVALVYSFIISLILKRFIK